MSSSSTSFLSIFYLQQEANRFNRGASGSSTELRRVWGPKLKVVLPVISRLITYWGAGNIDIAKVRYEIVPHSRGLIYH